MSYGRSPYYIWSDGDNFVFNLDEGLKAIPYDAIAQLIASMQWRKNGELEALIARGYELRPNLKEVS